MERLFSRRRFVEGAIGGVALVAGFGDSARSKSIVTVAERGYELELREEFPDQEHVRELAQVCSDLCGSLRHSGSLVLANGVPALIAEGEFMYLLPQLARGEVSTVPTEPQVVSKADRPRWSREVLLAPVFKGPADRPLVALTVDDGYGAREEILGTIVAKEASATFFLIGQVMEQFPDFVRRARDSGRVEFGNHTYTHADLRAKSWEQIANGEIKRSEDLLWEIAGQTTLPYARPAGGNRNKSVDEAFADRSCRPILWNVSGDAGTQWTSNNPKALADYYLGLLDRQQNPWGSIILMHFRPSTGISTVSGVPSAFELLIDGVRARGMEPVSLGKLYEDGRV